MSNVGELSQATIVSPSAPVTSCGNCAPLACSVVGRVNSPTRRAAVRRPRGSDGVRDVLRPDRDGLARRVGPELRVVAELAERVDRAELPAGRDPPLQAVAPLLLCPRQSTVMPSVAGLHRDVGLGLERRGPDLDRRRARVLLADAQVGGAAAGEDDRAVALVVDGRARLGRDVARGPEQLGLHRRLADAALGDERLAAVADRARPGDQRGAVGADRGAASPARIGARRTRRSAPRDRTGPPKPNSRTAARPVAPPQFRIAFQLLCSLMDPEVAARD